MNVSHTANWSTSDVPRKLFCGILPLKEGKLWGVTPLLALNLGISAFSIPNGLPQRGRLCSSRGVDGSLFELLHSSKTDCGAPDVLGAQIIYV